MKKKRGQKRNIKSSISELKTKHIFVLLGLFVVFSTLLMFNGNSIFTGEVIKGVDVSKIDGSDISNVFSKWEAGNVDNGISKIFIFFIVAILIFVSIDMLGVIKGSFIKFILAFAVSYLATAYITPDEVFGLVQSYTALGLTLTSVLPFVFLFLFSAKFLSAAKWGDAGKVMFDRGLWAVFTLFLVYRLGVLFFSETEYGLVVFVITGISVATAGFIVFAHMKYVGIIKDINIKLLESQGELELAKKRASEKGSGTSIGAQYVD